MCIFSGTQKPGLPKNCHVSGSSQLFLHIFIDEVTKLQNFINASASLADRYAAMGKRVVLAGTDSLGFRFARSGELFNRIEMIHTTFVSFREYHRLLNRDLNDYIRFGGTLTDGRQLYNDDRRTWDYTNSAIVDNITHSLQKWNRGSEYDILSSLADNGDLSSAIRKILEEHSGRFVYTIINNEFKSHDKGSLIDLLDQSEELTEDELDRLVAVKDDEIRAN